MSMSASARIFLCHSSYRHHPPNLLLRSHVSTHQLPSPYQFSSLSLLSHNHHHSKFLHRPSLNSFPIFSPAHFFVSPNYLDRLIFGPDSNSFRWNFAARPSVTATRNGVVVEDEGPEVAVVILGWLGAKPKHLRKYIEYYNAKGIHAVTFVASVMDVLYFDMGKKLEERIKKLANEFAAWLSNEGHRDRFLIFHTFSNTGWLVYGAILDNLKDRRDILDKFKGCIVDSGGDPHIDPKVWAAGFTTALLKKSSSATYPSSETGGPQLGSGEDGSKIEEKKPFLIETFLLSAFEKLFSYFLNLPDINQRLAKIISVLSKNQPTCPQLYLYGTGDKVIPFQRVELFIEEQRRTGKQVFSCNFGSSPHVDHFRTFPDLYASQLDYFLKECLILVGKL